MFSVVSASVSPPAVPFLLLALLIGLAAADHWHDGAFQTVKHPDTDSYLKALNATTLEAALAHYRTYGYPLFFRLLGWLGLGWPGLPYLQAAVYYGAVVLFFFAVRSYAGSAWLAFAAALPLIYAEIFVQVGLLQPDFLSAALALIATALLLLLAVRPASPALWTALPLVVFATYQVRPATVFLIGWIPLAGWLLRWLRSGGGPARHLRWATLLAVVTIVPYLGFAGLRLALVGHFGLVSFGGFNLSAVATSFLDDDLVRSLPDEHRTLARRILRRREARGWQPMTLGADSLTWFQQYNDNLWRVSSAAAWTQLRSQRRTVRRLERAGEAIENPALLQIGRRPRVLVNERLSELARAILHRRPVLYTKWVRDAMLYGLARLPGSVWIRWPTVLLVLSVVPAALIQRARRRRSDDQAAGAARRGLEESYAAIGLAILGISYAAIYMFLTSLVSFPFERYYLSIVLLLPTALCALLFEVWRRQVAGWTTRASLSTYQEQRPPHA